MDLLPKTLAVTLLIREDRHTNFVYDSCCEKASELDHIGREATRGSCDDDEGCIRVSNFSVPFSTSIFTLAMPVQSTKALNPLQAFVRTSH